MNKFLQLHIIIFFWGFTPILGKLISFGALDLVWFRLVFSVISLYLFVLYKKESLKLGVKPILHLFWVGAIVGYHWYLFYHAIKVSNVSVAMAGFSTITLFASVLQPILLQKKFFWGDFIYGIILVIGLAIIFNFEPSSLSGLIYGMLAALTSAFFGVYNGKLINNYGAYKITFYEFIGALVTVSITKLFTGDFNLPIPEWNDTIYLLLLSIVCTTIAFTWSVEILKLFSPLTIIITNNLEPVYGIVFGVLIFGDTEYMSAGFYIGALLILASVFTYPLIKSKFSSEHT
ncbi:MAG: DMT family transporter [Bacteroidia bacterium]|jgi:drug/metabolite transporter (DMT)-like permease|nr:DMT family transporter [Bacteroidia bacterium]